MEEINLSIRPRVGSRSN